MGWGFEDKNIRLPRDIMITNKSKSIIITISVLYILILTSCVSNKKASGTKSIYVDSVLITCKLFTSNTGIWFKGLKEARCLLPMDRYYDPDNYIRSIPQDIKAILKRELSSGGVDAPIAVSYLVDLSKDGKIIEENIYIQDYYFDDLFKK